MDLSKILSHDDDGDSDGDAVYRHNAPSTPPRHTESYSAAEMQCAVAILTDFHHPDSDDVAAVPAPRGKQPLPLPLPQQQRQYHHEHQQRRSPVFADHEERKSDNDDDDNDDDPMNGSGGSDNDNDATRSHASDVTTSGWTSGSDLMSKLDLLVQADEMIQSSSSSAAAAATVQPVTPSSSAPAAFVRSGVWLRAEEEYAAALIYYFLKGLLPLKEGTTLRKFLAEQLCCNRRRVSMKLATEAIAGRRIPRKVGASVFVTAPHAADARARVHATLESLRAQCFDPAATPALETRPMRPSKLQDELPELLVCEPLPASPQSHLRSSSSPPPPQTAFAAVTAGAIGKFELTSRDTGAADHDALAKRAPLTLKRELETTPKKKKALATTRIREVTELLRSPPGTGNIKRRKPTIIRTGFASVEEERYVTALFEFFVAGALALPDGTRLVAFLCEQLACSAKTLSMKLAPRRLGERTFPDNVGSITYMRQPTVTAHDAEHVDRTLRELRVACFDYANATPLPAPRSAAAGQSHSHSQSHNSYSLSHSHSHSSAATAAARERKHSNASTASSSSAATASPSRHRRAFSRSGPWSREEELYAAGLIDCFFKGVLELAEGTTLRAVLAARLSCNPMRVSKKLASEWIADVKIPKKLGSSTFVRRSGGPSADDDDKDAELALQTLRDAYLRAEALKDSSSAVASSSTVAGSKHTRAETETETDERQQQDDHVVSSRHDDDDDGDDDGDGDDDDDGDETEDEATRCRQLQAAATRASAAVDSSAADDDDDDDEDNEDEDETESEGEKSPKKPRTAREQQSSPPSPLASPHRTSKSLDRTAAQRKALASSFSPSAPSSPASDYSRNSSPARAMAY